MYLTDRIKETVQKVYHAAKDYATSQDLVRDHQDQLDKNIQHGLFPYTPKHDLREHYRQT